MWGVCNTPLPYRQERQGTKAEKYHSEDGLWGVCNTPLPYQQERGTQKQIMPPKGWTDIAPIHRSLRLLIITSNHYGNS